MADADILSNYFVYAPSLGAAILFSALFGLQIFLLSRQMMATKSWCLLWLVIFAAMEFGGYVARSVLISSSSGLYNR